MWINAPPTYLPQVGIGEVMRGLGLGEVIAPNSPDYRVGEMVQGLVGWQQCAVASPAAPLMPVEFAEGFAPSAYLGALGMTGLTAWVGMRDIGKPKPGDDWAAQLAAATPDGIGVDFENVGGDIIMDAIFARLNIGARVALCGLISGYNATDPPPGPRVRKPARPARDRAGLHRPRPFRARTGRSFRPEAAGTSGTSNPSPPISMRRDPWPSCAPRNDEDLSRHLGVGQIGCRRA